MFDLDALLDELARCAHETDPRRAADQVVRRALQAPQAVADAIAPSVGGISLLYHDAALTAINVAWAPGMEVMPHDHRMWAIIGIYAGTEDNQFFTRRPNGELAETAGSRLDAGDVCMLGTDAIHSVRNPAARLTAAIHVYGGDFVNQPRSQWGPGDRIERPYDIGDVNRQFHEANVAAGLVTC